MPFTLRKRSTIFIILSEVNSEFEKGPELLIREERKQVEEEEEEDEKRRRRRLVADFCQ
jgi:hypothetical protein